MAACLSIQDIFRTPHPSQFNSIEEMAKKLKSLNFILEFKKVLIHMFLNLIKSNKMNAELKNVFFLLKYLK